MVLCYPLKTVFLFFFTTAFKVLHKLTPSILLLQSYITSPTSKYAVLTLALLIMYMVPQLCYACFLLKAFALAMSLSWDTLPQSCRWLLFTIQISHQMSPSQWGFPQMSPSQLGFPWPLSLNCSFYTITLLNLFSESIALTTIWRCFICLIFDIIVFSVVPGS